MALLNQMGLSFYRMDLYPDATCPNCRSLLASAIASAQAHGITVLPLLIPPGKPSLYANEAAAHTAGFNMAQEYAKQFTSSGITTWELGNEYDVCALSCTDNNCGNPQSCGDGSTFSQYNTSKYAIERGLIRGMLDGIHSESPSALGIVNSGGWCHYAFQNQLLLDGVDFNLTGWHWYSSMGNIASANCSAGPTNVLGILKGWGKPIFLTEFNSNQSDSPSAQGSYLTTTMAQWTSLAPSNYIAGAFVYQLLDQNSLTYCNSASLGDGSCLGLADNNGTILQSGTDVQSYVVSPRDAGLLNWSAGQLTLYPGQEVKLLNGTFLTFQVDGNLVVYNSSNVALWASNTSGHDCSPSQNCKAVFQTDGNFVIYRGTTVLWATSTNPAGFILAFAASAPYLYIQDQTGTEKWSSGGNVAPPGVVNFVDNALNLLPGQKVSLTGGNYLAFQGDGNLVVYSFGGSALWSSKTSGHSCSSNCNAIFQRDGNLVIYQGTTALWQSSTADGGSLLSFTNINPFLEIINASNSVIWESH
jgi:hypothetical protein